MLDFPDLFSYNYSTCRANDVPDIKLLIIFILIFTKTSTSADRMIWPQYTATMPITVIVTPTVPTLMALSSVRAIQDTLEMESRV